MSSGCRSQANSPIICVSHDVYSTLPARGEVGFKSADIQLQECLLSGSLQRGEWLSTIGHVAHAAASRDTTT